MGLTPDWINSFVTPLCVSGGGLDKLTGKEEGVGEAGWDPGGYSMKLASCLFSESSGSHDFCLRYYSSSRGRTCLLPTRLEVEISFNLYLMNELTLQAYASHVVS